MKIRELLIEDLEIDFVDAISLVDYPAIEIDFQYFNNDKTKYTLAKIEDEDKRIITGPAMTPDKLIYRIDFFTGEEYYVYFKKDTIRELAYDYLMKDRLDRTTIDHASDVENVKVIESWVVENPENDKSSELGYKVPKGTWMVSMKVNDDDTWNKIKNGNIKGFSIEGWFSEKVIKNKAEFSTQEAIKHIVFSDKSEEDKLKIIKRLINIK